VGTIHVNGVTLHVEEHGTGAPILGIHGTGSSAQLWARSVPELAARGRVILYDRRGHGRSERPRPAATGVRDHTDDAAALIRALDAAPAVVIGRSYGGEVAVDLALRYPELTQGLVLLEPSMPMLAAESREWLADLRRQLAEGSDPAGAARGLIEAAFGEGTWEQLPDEMRDLFVDNGDAILAEVHSAWTEPSAQDLADLEAPTLLLSAEDSPRPFRAADDELAARIPGVTRRVLGGDHLIDPASPEVLAFLDELLGS
jgi:pimeloyl-ACP methyl ester carboxylesterase